MFPLKDKNDYKSCVIYKGDCFCGSRYIGETKRKEYNGKNIIIQLKVQSHQNTCEATSATILHGLSFQMFPKYAKTRKNLEALYIVLWKPDLKKQKDFERLVLFRNDVTGSN